MKNKYHRLLEPLKIRGLMFPDRVFYSSCGHSPTHKHPSSWDSTYDNGLIFYDKSLGGAAGLGVNYVTNIIEDGKFEKLTRDQIRELMSMAGQTGTKVGTGAHLMLFPLPGKDYSYLHPKTHEIKVDGWIPHGAPDQINWPQGMEVQKYVFRASDGVYDGVDCFEAPIDVMMGAIDRMCEKIKIAKEFGFEYFEVMIGGGVASFLSAIENKRSDEFGGSLENRLRYPLMVLEAARKAAGEDTPVFLHMQISMMDFRSSKMSHTPDEALALVKAAYEKGYIDALIPMAGQDTENKWNERIFSVTTIFQPRNEHIDFCKKVKETCPGLTVIAHSAWNDPDEMEDAVEKGICDGVSLGRAAIADPFFVKKLQENRAEDIRPCIRCNQCLHCSTDHRYIACSVNPRLFREFRVPLEESKADIRKKVVIIGGGPGGCSAAIEAYDRGHDVTIIEKSDCLGGMLKHAPYDKHKTDLNRFRNYQKIQVEKRNIKVLYNTTATPEMVASLKPDALIIAIGAEPIKPQIPGIENAKEAVSMYYHQNEIGHKVIMVGAGCVGAELTLQLAEDGHLVTMIDLHDEIATEGHFVYKQGLKHALLDVKDNWEAKLESRVIEIGKDYVKYLDKEGNKHSVTGDTIIYACGMRSRKEEAFGFYGIAPQTAMIGDCNRVGRVIQANTDGYFFAASL